MDTNKLQARPVALEELCKQPEKDSPHLLVLKEYIHTDKTHAYHNMTHYSVLPQV